MKRFRVFSVMLVFLLALGMVFISCDNGSTSDSSTTKFEGKWVNFDAIDNYGMTDVSFVFAADTFVFISIGRGDNTTINGTFTFTDTNISFSYTSSGGPIITDQRYEISDNQLLLYQSSNFFVSGPFTKQ